MAVQLARMRFVRIRGRIVPIRAKALSKRLPKEANKLVDDILKVSGPSPKSMIAKQIKRKWLKANRLGSGIDFNVFGPRSTKLGDVVLKFNRETKFRKKMPKILKKNYPGIEDPAVRSKTLGESLPNYGVPTIESQTVVLPGGKKGLLQEFQNFEDVSKVKTQNFGAIPGRFKDQAYLQRETGALSKQTGLDFDPNFGNTAPGGYLTDTALGRLPRAKDFNSGVTRELFEETAFNKKNADYVSDAAFAKNTSRKTAAKINKLIKKGYRFKPSGDFGQGLEYDLLSPAQRISKAKKKGVKFKGGKPVKPKRK